MPSFDIVSQVNPMEIENAVNQARKELANRFDFKGSNAGIALEKNEIKLSAEDQFKIKALMEIVIGKLAKRQISLKNVEKGEPDISPLGHARQSIKIKQGLAPVVGAFKIGSELFTSAGPEIVRRIRATGAAVFLDLKFHDIPNTVAKAVAAATRLDVQMLTIHTGGGLEMMQAAEQSAQETAKHLGRAAPLVLGVTVLTSMDSN